tara:strand:+ start:565 stop:699 length:135 start_codon:yes stop_codon:yes gene_type:complete
MDSLLDQAIALLELLKTRVAYPSLKKINEFLEKTKQPVTVEDIE